MNVKGFSVRRGINSDRLDPHLFTGPDNAQGNFAPVGNQNFFKQDLYSPLLERSETGFLINWDQ
jgi:hypothetical protein